MKKTLTLLLTVLVCTLHGQPTITSDFLPEIGDMILNVVGKDVDLIEPGESGANIFWDYSNVKKDEKVPNVVFEYVAPSESTFADLYPDATLAVAPRDIYSDSMPVTFYHASDERFELLGSSKPMVSHIYTVPRVFMMFPFSVGDSFEEDFETVNEINGLMSVTYGNVLVEADAYGTITTPQGTFDDVVRIKYTTNRIDSTGFASDNYTLLEQMIENYVWLKNTFGNSIASLTISSGMTTTVTGDRVVTEDLDENRSFSWNGLGVSSERQIDQKLSFKVVKYSPNPVYDNLEIIVHSECNCNLKMEVMNPEGHTFKIRNYDLKIGDNKLTLDVNRLPRGAYHIKITNKQGAKVIRFQKL